MIRASVRSLRAIALILAVAVVGGWLALPRPDAATPSVVPAANAAAAVGIVSASPSAGPGASAAVTATAGATASSATVDPAAPPRHLRPPSRAPRPLRPVRRRRSPAG